MKERERLILDHLRLVYYFARVYRGHCCRLRLSKDDLIQEGSIALLRAADNFKPELGYKFSTYAASCIRLHLRTIMRKNHEYVIRELPDLIGEHPQEILPWIEVSAQLTDMEKAVIRLHLFEEFSFSEVGKQFNLSRQRIHQIEKSAKKKLADQTLEISEIHPINKERGNST